MYSASMYSAKVNDQTSSTPPSSSTRPSPKWPAIIGGAFIVYAGLRSSMPMKAVCVIGGLYVIYNNLPKRPDRSGDGEPSTFSIDSLQFVTAALNLMRAVIKFFNTQTTGGGSNSRGSLSQRSTEFCQQGGAGAPAGAHQEGGDDGDDTSHPAGTLTRIQNAFGR
jgi:hypothetical protein